MGKSNNQSAKYEVLLKVLQNPLTAEDIGAVNTICDSWPSTLSKQTNTNIVTGTDCHS